MARVLFRLQIVIAAMVLTGCSAVGTVPSAAPSAAPSVAPAPPTLAIGSVPPASALPSDLIACTLTANTLDVSLHTPHGIVDARGTLVAAGGTATPSPNPDGPNAGALVGDQSYTTDFSLDLGDHQQSIAPKSVIGSVLVGGSTHAAKVNAKDTSAGITLPDGSGAATLTLSLTFDNTPCPDLLATVQMPFDLVSAAAAAACPTDQPGYIALLDKLKPALTFGSVTRQFAIQSFAARFVNVAGIDQVAPFSGFDPNAPAATTKAGSAIRIESAAPGLAIDSSTIQTWRRSDVVGPDGKLVATPGQPVDTQSPAAPKGGSLTWQAPSAPGAYVVGLQPAWSQACMTGTGYAYLSVTLN